MSEVSILNGYKIKDKKAIRFYDTVDDMKNDSTLKEGMHVKTKGYYSVNDGGGAEYYITATQSNSDYQEELENDLYATLIINDDINVKQLGAYGNGENDDTSFLNNALLLGYLKEKNVYIPDGTYNISSPLIIYGCEVPTKRGNKVYGDTMGSPKLVAITNELTEIIQIKAYGDYERASHIFLSNIALYGDNKAVNGITIKSVLTSSVFENISINDCTGAGIGKDSTPDVYLDTFRKIRCFRCGTGIKLNDGNNTSLRIVDCYMMGCTNGYHISSSYSNLTNCCADSISNYVYNMNYFTGVLINCASESPEAKYVYLFSHATATLIQPWAYGNPTDSTSAQIALDADSHVVVEGGRLLLGASSITEYPGKLFTLGSSCSIELNNVSSNKYASKDAINIDRPITSNNSFGLVTQRDNGRMAYIGRDTVATGGLLNNKNDNDNIKANAIYFGLGTSYRYMEDGTDLQYARKNVKGDILLTRKPLEVGGIGWVQAEDVLENSGATWNSGTFLKIPVVMSGSTANRPTTNLTAGQMYLDTTLIKPIWWTGSRWIDSTGTTV